MNEQTVTGVDAAFETLFEEIEGVIDDVNKTGARAFEQGNLNRATDVLEQAKTLTGFRAKLASMRKEWSTLYAEQADEVKDEVSRRDLGRLEAGVRTREEAYVIPILTAIEELGGSGKMAKVLDRVHQLMKGVLKPIDEEALPSDPNVPRWRNAGQWARLTMVHDGLLKDSSPRGVWEITDAGKAFLKTRR